MAVVFVLVLLVTSLVIRDGWVGSNDATATRLALLADGHSERARLMLVESYRRSGFSLPNWLDGVNPDRGATPRKLTPPTAPETEMLAGRHEAVLDGVTLRWRVTEVSPPGGNGAWVRVAATATDGRGSQTVTRKVSFGENDIFDFALLTETTDCMFCHLQVRGDVGTLKFFRPGGPSEGDRASIGQGRLSRVTGDVIAAREVSSDERDANHVNGLHIEGRVVTNYGGQRLPPDVDGDGVPDFPPLDADVARRSANGSLSGGRMQGVPIGGEAGKVLPNGRLKEAENVNRVNRVYQGNLVLVGTPQDPIVLDRDVYVTGDVIVRGVVKGRGALYSGRNLYLAGDVVNANPADKPGAGVCSGTQDEDECARRNIAAGRDETRLAAANNIVMGSFTERRDDGSLQARVDRQAADYMRAQFGLQEGSAFYVRRGTSEEVRRRPDGRYVTAGGREVAASEVVNVEDDPYRALMAPGSMDASGRFRQWISDEQYDRLLGLEDMPYGTWRSTVNTRELRLDEDPYPTDGMSAEDRTFWRKVRALEKELADSGLPVTFPEEWCPKQACGWTWARDVAYHLVRNEDRTGNYWGVDKDGRVVSGSFKTVPSGDGRPTLYVAVVDARPYKQESTRVDAFLYANGRIGGKLGNRGGHLNGGMIAREIGVLAPGKSWANDHFTWTLPWEQRLRMNECRAGTHDVTQDAYWIDGVQCGYSINYDRRLRNGGYGFNLIRGTMGGTAEWKLDTTGTEAVTR